MKRIKRGFRWLTLERSVLWVGTVFIVIGGLALLLGMLNLYFVQGQGFIVEEQTSVGCMVEDQPSKDVFKDSFLIDDFYANITVEMLSVGLALFFLDTFARWRSEKDLKARLIRELRSSDKGIARNAASELCAHGLDPENHDSWMTDGSLKDAFLLGTNLEGENLRLQQPDLRSAFLTDAVLNGITFYNAKLQGALLDDAKLKEANLYLSKMNGAYLRGASLQGAFLEEASLQKTDFTGANLTKTALSGADLKETNFRDVVGLSAKQLRLARRIENTVMPDGSELRDEDALNEWLDCQSNLPVDEQCIDFEVTEAESSGQSIMFDNGSEEGGNRHSLIGAMSLLIICSTVLLHWIYPKATRKTRL